MADGYTTFEVLGYVKIFIQFNQIKTSIIVGVVKSLCTDCILGMDYINKYKVNLNNKEKQIQIHTSDDNTTIPMQDKNYKLKTICQLINPTYIYPYQEKRIKIVTQVSSGQMLFSPAYHLTYKKGLVTPHSLISIVNHVAWISIYNPTAQTCYLKQNIIVGVASPSLSITHVSTILNLTTKHKLNGDQIRSLTPSYERNIMSNIRYEANDCKPAKAPSHQLSINNSDPSSEEIASSDDQSLQEEGHEFDVLAIAEAQNTDKLYQEKVSELKKNVTNCPYITTNGILYKLCKRGVFTRKLIYVPPSILNQLLNVYHNVLSVGHFGFHRIYYKLKDKYWWPDMKTTIYNYIQSCLKCQKFNLYRYQPAPTKFSSYQGQFGCQLNVPIDKLRTTYQFSKLNDFFCPFQQTLPVYHQ